MTEPLKRTPLHAAHQRLKARIVEFCGWSMPLHYGSQIREHLAVRERCGVFDISHMLALDIQGRDASAFLRRLLANDAAKLARGKALYACMLNQTGGVLDDLIAYDCGGGRYRLVVNACTADTDLAWMGACKTSWGAAIEIVPRRDLAMLAVQGPQARDIVWQTLPPLHAATAALPPFAAAEVGALFIARTGYTGEDGFEISLPAGDAGNLWQALLEAGATPCGLGARDTLRLEAGMCLYGQDMDTTTLPWDAALGWTVDLTGTRDFVGRSALEIHAQTCQFLGLVLQGGGVLRAGMAVRTPHGAGRITSGSYSPTLRQAIALARLPLASRPGDRVEVELHGRPLPARVVKPPFVRHGKILV